MKRNGLILAIVALVALTGASANASLIGDEIDGFLEAPNTQPGINLWNGTPDFQTETVVADGFEFYVGDAEAAYNITADIGESDIWIQFWIADIAVGEPLGNNVGELLGDSLVFWFEDINWVESPASAIQDVILTTTLEGVEVIFGPHEIHVRVPDQYLEFNAGIHLQIVNKHVPEPASMTLLGLGLAGMAARRLRKKRV